MSRRGASAADVAWAPNEVALFFEAFHQHGSNFEQIAAAVGGGRTAEACEALHRKHASYLAIPKEFQSVQAFTAMVENAQKEAAAEQAVSGEEGAGSGGGAGSRPKLEDVEEEEEGEEGEDAQASGREGSDVGDEDGYCDHEEPGLAAGRSRRTPKRSGLRTPLSAAKRGRGDENIYEYYGEGADVTESARKRRARGAPDFPASQRRRHDTDEAKGIDALLALAVAGEESLGGMDSEDGGSEQAGATARGRKGKGRARTPQRRARARPADDEDEDYEPADAGEMDDDKEDEDFAPPASRRTPYSTPAKAGRLGRPGSAHVTPRRSGGRGSAGGVPALAAASPAGLALRGFSPFHMLTPLESGGDMLTDLGLADLSYITSPGFPQFQQGFVPSPQNPMPRLRRRKSAPERVQPSVSSPIRTLFTRRSSLAGPLLPGFGYAAGEDAAAAAGAVGPGAGAAGAPQSAAEAQLRHCLQQPRTQRWAAAEFCYSSLDRPFFMFNPLSSLLTAMGLGQDARLTRREWAVIRSGLGKPRRLSLRFLREERARLERWREGCREQYQSGAAAADPKVADHLPRPLGVGQRVVARHPSTRQLHDGSVLTVAHDCYRVQFDRQELGVELVRDTDVFPCDPTENLPPAVLLGASRLLLNGRAVINGQPVRPLAPPRLLPPPAGLSTSATAAATAAAAASTPLPTPTAAGGLPPGSTPEPSAGAAAAPADSAAPAADGQQQQARPADAKALAELVVGLDKKEALLLQLRAMNDEAAAGVHSADASGAAAPGFVGAYAGVVLQLKEVNEKVRDKLEELESSGASGEAGPSGEHGAGAPAAPQLQHQQLGASLAADAALQRRLAAQSPEALSAAAAEQARRIIAACQAKLEESAAAETEEGGEGEEGQQAGGAEASDLRDAEAGAEEEQEQQREEQRGATPTAASAADAAPVAASVGGGASSQQPSSQPGEEAPPGLDWSSAQGQQLASLIQGCVHSLVLLQRGAGADGGLSPSALGAALDAALEAVAPREASNSALFEEVKAAMAGLKLQIGAVAS